MSLPFKLIFVCCLVLLCPHIIYAEKPHLSELLTNNSNAQNIILFTLDSAEPASISEIRLHFLKSEDCYSGYLQSYRTGNDTPFVLKNNQPFGLSGVSIYRIAKEILNSQELINLQAILIRFVDRNHGQRYQQFARFLGSCQDQEINCCIPISCAPNVNFCSEKYNISMQNIVWLSE